MDDVVVVNRSDDDDIFSAASCTGSQYAHQKTSCYLGGCVTCPCSVSVPQCLKLKNMLHFLVYFLAFYN